MWFNTKYMILSFAILFAFVGAYLLFIGNPLNDIADLMSKGNEVLKRGSTGKEVAALQTALQEKGYNIAIDEDFGQQTEKILFEATGKTSIRVKDIKQV